MKYVQVVSFEISPECNLGKQHTKCPNQSSERYQFSDKTQILTTDLIIKTAIDLYRNFEFSGLVAFHYYNEPLLSYDKICVVIYEIKKVVPTARFLLWTNGTLITPFNVNRLRLFDKIVISNYAQKDFSFVKNVVTDVTIIKPNLDLRLEKFNNYEKNIRCSRPFVEIIFDYYADAHLCCFDWRGNIKLGNLYKNSLKDICANFLEARSNLFYGIGQIPSTCRFCKHASLVIPKIDEFVYNKTKIDLFKIFSKSDVNKIFDLSRSRIKHRRNKGKILYQKLNSVPNGNTGWWRQYNLHRVDHQIDLRPETKKYSKNVPFYAIIGTWYENDIIEATVKNCFAQGCDRVYLLDNASPDNTVETAVKAGAILYESYETDYYLEDLRLKKLNDAINTISLREKHSEIWWLCLDADELPAAPHHLTIRDLISETPISSHTIGCIFLDYYPTKIPANIRGFHPAEFQDSGHIREYIKRQNKATRCWKHSVLCWKPNLPLFFGNGMHTLCSSHKNLTVYQPENIWIYTHHFQYRNYCDTKERLINLCNNENSKTGIYRQASDDKTIGCIGSTIRYQQLEDIYAGNFHRCKLPHNNKEESGPVEGIPVQKFDDILDPSLRSFRRWYTQEQLNNAISEYFLKKNKNL